MKTATTLIRHFGRLRLAAAILTALPLLLVPLLGVVWLWQSDWRWYWLLALAGCGIAGYALHLLLARLERKEIPVHATETKANPLWPPAAEACWAEVEKLAATVSPEQWPLNDIQKLSLLGRNTLEKVARHYHPNRTRPLLEMTVPHTLLIIEMASRDLRKEIVDNIPFSHQLTAGALVRANRWREITKSYESWYRAGRVVVSPYTAVFSELRRSLAGSIMSYGVDKLKTWLLQEYVRKVGYYAIALYSGQLLFDDGKAVESPTRKSAEEKQRASEAKAAELEPLRILLLGRTNVGKSSLINALFGELTAAADLMPHTTQEIVPYLLERDGNILALIFDAPGIDTELLGARNCRDAVLDADLILWVTAVHRPDREAERQQLDLIRTWFADDPSRRPPPMLVVATHIDMLPPARQWQPPYDLNESRDRKAQNIAAAIAAVATDLNVPSVRTIPVCLAPERIYNVEDTLWAAILNQQDEAGRTRFLRCLKSRRREENWALAWRQLSGAGRVLLDLPKRILNSTGLKPKP
jgi:uncharacterized protein